MCLQAVEFASDRYTRDIDFRWVVARTRTPEAFWVVEDPRELGKAIRGRTLKASSIHRDNPLLHFIDVETTDDARKAAESMGVARWLEPPWTQLQRAVVAVLHWRLWKGFEDLPSHRIDWWMSALGCHLSRSSVLRIQSLVEEKELTLETLWRADSALETPLPARAIERFLALGDEEREQILTKALVDPLDDPVSALLRTSLPQGRLSVDNSRARITALMAATQKYGERAMLLAVRDTVTELLHNLATAQTQGDSEQ